ncbi:geranylgeranyl diphosphate synthase, type II [Flavobacteriaceae bacterium MAR_2010_188]|nr:geranylgeranyl diphosphate synthase, type II [Flavobacteriaceae bacterium MAR_2010_188]
MQKIPFYQEAFGEYLNTYHLKKEPKSLYEPIAYILGIGGKRLRPVLTLLTADIFEGDYKNALDAALSVEVFHNFSLVHDDIMDDAPLRRGKESVHEKWDLNTGILSGDAMLIMAYQLFENYPAEVFKSLAQLFSKTALEVCEGQQYDVDFENRDEVSISEYFLMIEYKTAVLVGAAMKMGAIVAKASKEDQNSIYEFGKNLGIAFQIQDDYLDTFGDPETFGKQIGGDIIENKKTLLYLKTMEAANQNDRELLAQLYSISPENPHDKVETITGLFKKYQADLKAKTEIESFTKKAFTVLDQLSISESKKDVLRNFGRALMSRKV